MRKKNKFVYSMALLASFAALNLGAAETNAKLSEVVVSATGFEQDADSNLRNVIIISGDELRDKGYTSLEQALTREANINFTSFGNNTQKSRSIDMRGQGDQANSGVKVMLDGVTMNTLDTVNIHAAGVSSNPLATIDVDDIERIEIIPGGGAVLYGSGTRGGVINIITRKSKESSYSVGLKGSAYDSGRFGGHLLANINQKINDNFALNFSLDGFNTKGYRRYDTDKGFYAKAKALVDFSDETSLNLGLGYYKDKLQSSSPVSKETADNEPRQQGVVISTYDISRPEINAELKHKFSENFESNFQAFYQQQKTEIDNTESKNLTTNPIFYPAGTFNDDIYGVNLKNKLSYADKSYFIFGYTYENHLSKTDSKVQFPGQPVTPQNTKTTKQSHALFALDSHQFTDIFNLSGGARYEYAHYKLDGVATTGRKTDLSTNTNNFALEITPNVAYSDTGKVYVKFERGFVSPAPLYFRYTGRFDNTTGQPTTNTQNSTQRYVLNEDLKSETYNTYEVGVSDYLWGFYDISAAVFYTDSKDEIKGDMTPNEHGANTYYNVPKTRRYGVEINARQDVLDNLYFYENFAFVDAKVTSAKKAQQEGLRVPLVSRYKVAAGVNYAFMPEFSTFLDLTYNSKAKEELAKNSKWIKEYFLTDIGATYTYDNFKIVGGIRNLFDYKYYSYQSNNQYISAEGRNYYVEFRYKF